MVSTIQNTDVKQKDADRAVVVAVTSRAVFESGADGDDVYGMGVAFPLLQALQRVNKRLLEENPAESLLFDVVLITTDSQQQQQSCRIISSTRHYGVLSALLDRQEAPSEQLRVMFCGDAVNRPDAGPMPASRQAAQNFSAQLGEMRQRFGMSDSPLRIVLVTSHGGRESCGALRTLRSHGVNVDEAYCLAGAPRSPILSVVRPHFLLSDGFSGLED
ncbi:cytosolic 5'-nucleotidase 1A isoform X2 [Perca flavescens]|uniref:cytosolic 5'-nucleotidase 1A isoform X2 n=1 Tax=Perca flavescens TaxID=8167 RepID=UPI00106EE370|nr:cytosolic 5'-nucleotidase 1A-like isoform X2 [Perca flavescens]